jgi:hypothetical protein
MVIGVALIGVIGVALIGAFIAVIITTKEIMRASPRHPRQAFRADRQCGDMGKRRALAALRPREPRVTAAGGPHEATADPGLRRALSKLPRPEPFLRFVRNWRIPEMPPAATNGRLRLQSGPRQTSNGVVYEFTPILCGQLHRPNVFQGAPKMRLRSEAHGKGHPRI